MTPLRIVCQEIGLERHRVNEWCAAGLMPFLPVTEPGVARMLDDQHIGMLKLFSQCRKHGWNIKAASDFVLMIRDGIVR